MTVLLKLVSATVLVATLTSVGFLLLGDGTAHVADRQRFVTEPPSGCPPAAMNRGEGEDPSKRKRMVALLIFGNRAHALRELGPSWVRNVADPLDADVFLYIEDRLNSTSAALHGLGAHRITAMIAARQPSEDEIIAQFRTSPKMRSLIGAFPQWEPGSDLGNGCFPSVLLLYYWMEHVYRLACGHEAVRGMRYERMIFARPDLEFLYEHVPIALLPPDRLSTMAVSGYHGVPLVMFTCPRHLCNATGTLYSSIMQGMTAPALDDLNYNCHSKTGNEVYWRTFFAVMSVPLSQYLAPGCIVCLETQDSSGEFAWHRGRIKLCPPTKRYKYDGDICAKNAALLRRTGWLSDYVWNLAPEQEGRPVHETQAYDPSACGHGACLKINRENDQPRP